MSTWNLLAQWKLWVAALAAPLHRRLQWRLSIVVAGILLASGRRTVTQWCRGAEVTTGVRSYYYFLDVVGRKTYPIAAQLLKIIAREIPTTDRLLFAIDDTPTQRYGPKVQGAGIHHNPTPGPAGSNFLYGHSWVTLSQVVKHDHFGTIGLPLLGQLYVRQKDVPGLPAEAKISFQTKLQMAGEMLTWLGSELPKSNRRPWAVVDGAYAKRAFLRPAMKAGFTVVARLRKDAALFDLPPVLPPGVKRGQGRPPVYGKNPLSLAKRAGQKRGWTEVTTTSTTGRLLVEHFKTFLATWRPAGGVIRVVILKTKDDSWRAFLCSDPQAEAQAIVEAVRDRWSIEQNYHDLKEVEGIEQVQLRRVWSNVGALNLSLWVHTLIEVWSWKQDASVLRDRRDRPWDDPNRRPSHADRRGALRRAMWGEEYQRLGVPERLCEKILPFFDRIIKLAG